MARTMAGAGLAAVAGIVAACTGGGASSSSATQSAPPLERTLSPTTSPQAYPAAAWPTFNGNAARSGVVTGLPAAGRLSIAWKAHLDGTVYGQPLLIGDLVVAATENDTFYALDRSTGKVVWSRHVATPLPKSGQHGCGDIDPLGITGTPVYDQGNGLVYGVAQTSNYQHILFGVSVSDGAVRVERYIPTPDGQQAWDQQRPALAMADGRAYVSFGGLVGDCGPYIGSVVGVPLSGAGSLVSYRTPTTREGAVWGTAGPVTGPDGDLYVAIGNGAATSSRWDGSESVNKLSPTLQRLSYFAPSYWAADNVHDYDLGSTQPALVDGDSLFSMGKRGVGYLLDATSLGGIGGQEADLPVCKPFGAASVDGSTVYEPCSGGGTAAIALNPASKTIRVLWRGPASADGSPVVGGGAVWATDWHGETLYELSQSSGAVKQQISLGAGLPHFSSLTLGYGTAFVGTLDGVTAVTGA